MRRTRGHGRLDEEMPRMDACIVAELRSGQAPRRSYRWLVVQTNTTPGANRLPPLLESMMR